MEIIKKRIPFDVYLSGTKNYPNGFKYTYNKKKKFSLKKIQISIEFSKTTNTNLTFVLQNYL